MYDLAQGIMAWSELYSVTFAARYIPKKKNVMVDQLSCLDQVLPLEWSPLLWVFDANCEVYSCPHIDVFGTRANTKL